MRDNFAVEYGKRPISRSGDAADNLPHSKWAYYQQLIFLKDVVTPRASSGSFRSLIETPQCTTISQTEARNALAFDCDAGSSQTSSQEATAIPETDINEQFQEHCVSVRESDERGDNSAGISETHTGATIEHTYRATNSPVVTLASPIPRPHKRKQDDYYRQIVEIERQKLDFLSSKQAKRADEEADADHMFLKALLPHIRKIPEHKKLCFQARVQEVVQEFAYSCHSMTNEDIIASRSQSSPSVSNYYGSYSTSSKSMSPSPLSQHFQSNNFGSQQQH